jgi:hypothetical protein
MILNKLSLAANALGKGEVDSSILSGSTRKMPVIQGHLSISGANEARPQNPTKSRAIQQHPHLVTQ